jgi:hypothetical protein
MMKYDIIYILIFENVNLYNYNILVMKIALICDYMFFELKMIQRYVEFNNSVILISIAYIAV